MLLKLLHLNNLPFGVPPSNLQRFGMGIWKPSSASSSACPATSSSSSRLSDRVPSLRSRRRRPARTRTPPWASRAALRHSSANLRMGLCREQRRQRCSPGEPRRLVHAAQSCFCCWSLSFLTSQSSLFIISMSLNLTRLSVLLRVSPLFFFFFSSRDGCQSKLLKFSIGQKKSSRSASPALLISPPPPPPTHTSRSRSLFLETRS